jgi:hypothetical protein
VRRFSSRLAFSDSDSWGVQLWRYSVANAEDIARAVGTIQDFLTDHLAVLARSHDNCCVCGRALTDELSRSRGIGPECIQKIGCIGILPRDWNQLVARESSSV